MTELSATALGPMAREFMGRTELKKQVPGAALGVKWPVLRL
jgi:hypothetical protein